MRVALIDDDEDLRVAVQLALKSAGVGAHGFADCDSASRWMTEAPEPPDAVLLDVHVDAPGMSPKELIAWMRAGRFKKTPVLLVTAAIDAAARTREFGADGYVVKPFDAAHLVERIEAITGKRS